MTGEVEHIILEHLRHMRVKIDQISADVTEVKARLMTIEAHNAANQLDILRHTTSIETLDARLRRLEQRLDIVQ